MPLSCSCDFDFDPEPGQWMYWFNPDDFEIFDRWIRKRCQSCKELINIGTFCLRFNRYRHPYNEIESRITGVDWEDFEEPNIKVADHFHCEKCGEIYLNLQSVGFECISPSENMPEMLRQYQHDYAPPKLSKK